ncbi:uncharacterized protein TNIN_188281 [Trichonephila inaurata madagascariensis]|uniref:Uncharacterized protein n=1 Tax=Trichonephila inaurata madagascariensis TaxID=2747483 RepID=A0A8X6YGK8_9ARAC|nr:uncharacterized protein TNIN_188281 [Trichonephila inaurata madagascariensis]
MILKHCKVPFILTVFYLLKQFSISNSHDPDQVDLEFFYEREVADFENWFQEKIQNHEVEIPRTSENSMPHQRNGHHRRPQEPIFEKKAEVKHTNRDEDNNRHRSFKSHDELFQIEHRDILPSTNQETGNDNFENRERLSGPSSIVDEIDDELEAYVDTLLHPVKKIDDGIGQETEYSEDKIDGNRRKHHVEDIVVVIHKSDSDLTASSVEFLNEISPSGEPENKQDEPKLRLVAEDFPDEPMAPDVCSVTNHRFNDKKTCSSSAHYTFEPHFSAPYSKNVKKQMKKRYAKNRGEDDSICDYRTEGPDLDVTERALCPFTWNVSKRNPARIPEYLYEAKCACQKSRGVTHTAVCVELKSKIRVLWRVGCENNLHVYKEGWEEINVACVPVGQATGEGQPGARIKFPPLTNSQT